MPLLRAVVHQSAMNAHAVVTAQRPELRRQFLGRRDQRDFNELEKILRVAIGEDVKLELRERAVDLALDRSPGIELALELRGQRCAGREHQQADGENGTTVTKLHGFARAVYRPMVTLLYHVSEGERS